MCKCAFVHDISSVTVWLALSHQLLATSLLICRSRLRAHSLARSGGPSLEGSDDVPASRGRGGIGRGEGPGRGVGRGGTSAGRESNAAAQSSHPGGSLGKGKEGPAVTALPARARPRPQVNSDSAQMSFVRVDLPAQLDSVMTCGHTSLLEYFVHSHARTHAGVFRAHAHAHTHTSAQAHTSSHEYVHARLGSSSTRPIPMIRLRPRLVHAIACSALHANVLVRMIPLMLALVVHGETLYAIASEHQVRQCKFVDAGRCVSTNARA